MASRVGVATAVGALVFSLIACSRTAVPSPESSVPSPHPSTTPAPAALSSGDAIVIASWKPAFALSPFVKMSNAFLTTTPGRSELVTQLIYNGLYRYDDSLTPVPDLAAEPCGIAPDQVTITCRLVDATFHDGSPVTADDVAFTYELGRRNPECLFAFGECFGEMLESVRAVDERTVEFRLTEPNATFFSLILPNVFIDSRAVVEAAYAPLAGRSDSLDPAEYRAAATALLNEVQSAEPACDDALAEVDADALLEAASIEPPPRDQFMTAEGMFQSCFYAEWSGTLLSDIAGSLETTGLEAVSSAYRALSFNRSPIGTGPWKFSGIEGGTRVTLVANEAFHRGPPATPRIEIRVYHDPEALLAGVRSGEIDWAPLPRPDMYAAVEDGPGLQFARHPESTYFMLAYNLREGMLFADRNLRTAVELCIDKAATVDAATDGAGDVVYTPIVPISWAYQEIQPVERDVPEGRRVIEAAGWSKGDDGIYERNGERLSADVFVLAIDPTRVAFLDLVAEQVRDCGIELNVIPADPDTVLGPLDVYPDIPGGYEEPFEAVFIGWFRGPDPHDALWHSRSLTSPERPRNLNFLGFSDQRVDALLDKGVATYDQRERARIYRELQLILADEHPALFAWAGRRHEALDQRLGLTEGELNLVSQHWWWELEKLVLRDGA